MTDFTNVSARAMLVSLQISTWSARKFDRRVSAEVNESHAAAKDASRVNKHLLSGAAAHADLLKRAGAARSRHYAETLPWADEGWRLLPTANFESYTDAMRHERATFDRLLTAFLDEYPVLREQARQTLGTLYKEEDFPTAQNIRSRFGWAIEFSPVPSGGDIRVDLPTEQLSRIEQSVTDRVEQAAKAAMQDAWARLREAVARIQKASGPDGIVRGNLIEHAQAIVDVLGRLNVGEDADLEAMRQRVAKELTSIAPEDLRKDERLPADTAKRATDIMSSMSAFYAPQEQEVA